MQPDGKPSGCFFIDPIVPGCGAIGPLDAPSGTGPGAAPLHLKAVPLLSVPRRWCPFPHVPTLSAVEETKDDGWSQPRCWFAYSRISMTLSCSRLRDGPSSRRVHVVSVRRGRFDGL